MAPVAPSLAQSEPKSKFFNRIGLEESNKTHRHLYTLMKGEAADGWTRITQDRNSLLPQFREDRAIGSSYSFGMITEAAVQREIVRIYQNARPDTKIMYGLGHDTEGDVESNWIIRWLLWHVFRYRDERNAGICPRVVPSLSPTAGSDADIAQAIGNSSDITTFESTVAAATTASEEVLDIANAISPAAPGDAITNTTRYWDPVRERFRS
ncbi:Hypothetical predicted protein [Lecanosticta acicola]|uniref:Uncharacterized protein n=1 Tax=Lecanosticta acicola TaxID=111012 RepID=A0AAI9E9D5_9PEZI|nr:Hypothetical predicted protein [Lecanosticta acicola]